MRSAAKRSTAGSSTRPATRLAAVRGALLCAAALAAFLGSGAPAALAAAPAASIEPAEAGVTAALATGEVDPEDHETFFHFEYVTQAQFEAEGFAAAEANGQFAGFGSFPENGPAATVTGELFNLIPATTYHLRLVAENTEAEKVEAIAPTFETEAATVPILATATTDPVGYTRAVLRGTLDPRGGNANPPALGGTLGINWELQYREAGQEWSPAGAGEISGAEAEEEKALPLSAELPAGTLQVGHSYEVRLFANYLGFSRQTVSPAIPQETFTTLAPPAPSPTEPSASAITGSSAHFEGEVDTQAPTPGSPEEEADFHVAFDAECHFDYVKEAQFLVDGFASAKSVECAPNPVAGAATVSGEATNLEPHTTYHLRLRAENRGGQGTASAASTFTTEALAPLVGHTFVDSVGAEGATLEAQINPRGDATAFHFEYLGEAEYQQNLAASEPGFAGATSTPQTPLGAGDNAEHLALATIEGLQPGAKYRFKAIAANSKGAAEGEARWLMTGSGAGEEGQSCANAGMPGVGTLPDCRAWEMVSPPDKHGGDVMGDSSRVRIATDDEAVTFASLVGFGDVQGTGIAADYMAERTAAPGSPGWSTHAITPPQDQATFLEILAADVGYADEFSPDLRRGVFRAISPLTEDPDVADVLNLYRRTDLRDPGRGSYQLLSACPLCDSPGAGPLPPLPAFAAGVLVPMYGGASSDLETVVFESRQNLTADAPPQPFLCAKFPTFCNVRVYEWDHGELRFDGLIPPPGEPSCGGGGPACVAADYSMAANGVGAQSPGSIARRPLHAVSNDGSRVFFTVPASSGDLAGDVYERVNGTRTDQLNASERTDCAGDPSCGGDSVPDPAPDTHRSAVYWTASVDGSRVFITSPEALTDDAPLGGDKGLYMYDTTKPASDPHNLTYLNVDAEAGQLSNDVSGVIGASDDGHYVYFVTSGQLVPDAPQLKDSRGIFLWHDGEIRFVGDLVGAQDTELYLTGPNFKQTPTQARVTPDGRHLLFGAHNGAGLQPEYDHGPCGGTFGSGCLELYLYSADTGSVVCASCTLGGKPPSTHAFTTVHVNSSQAMLSVSLSRAISDDGSRVFFTTGEPLLSADTNGRNDVYEYKAPSGALHLISSGTDSSDSYFMSASKSGDDVFFITRQRLVGWDEDGSYDLYDARVGGGFPEPPPSTAPCSGDSCKGTSPSPPGVAAIGSTLSGAGNPQRKPHPRCAKGRRKVHRKGKARCVREHHSKHGRPATHKRANADRRASR